MNVQVDTPTVGPKGGTGTPPKWTIDLLDLLKTKIEEVKKQLQTIDPVRPYLNQYLSGKVEVLLELKSYLENVETN